MTEGIATERLDHALDELMLQIGRLCADPHCAHCARARELGRKLHGSPPPVDACRCSFCRELRRLLKGTLCRASD